MKKLKSNIYTKGKFNKLFIETTDTNNEFLYSYGKYPTKIRKEDLTDDYVEFRSRVTWYMIGYIKTSGVVDIKYKATKMNHLFKDDYLYISYKEQLREEVVWNDYIDYVNYDVCVCGNSIIPILLSIEKFSNVDTSQVRKQIIDKFDWWKENCRDDFERCFHNKEIDIFEFYERGENKYDR